MIGPPRRSTTERPNALPFRSQTAMSSAEIAKLAIPPSPYHQEWWRSERQIAYTKEPIGDHHFQLDVGIGTKQNYWVTKGDLIHAREWYARGLTNACSASTPRRCAR